MNKYGLHNGLNAVLLTIKDIEEIERALAILKRIESGESVETPVLVLARNQPCGCVVCTCASETQCHGCGAKHCGTHPVGKMPAPVYVKSEHAEMFEAWSRMKSGESVEIRKVNGEWPTFYANGRPNPYGEVPYLEAAAAWNRRAE